MGTETGLLSTLASFSRPQASVYCVAAVLWMAAKFSVPQDHKLALPRRLKTLLLEMARRSAQERPSVAEAVKVAWQLGTAGIQGLGGAHREETPYFQEKSALGREGTGFLCGGPITPALPPDHLVREWAGSSWGQPRPLPLSPAREEQSAPLTGLPHTSLESSYLLFLGFGAGGLHVTRAGEPRCCFPDWGRGGGAQDLLGEAACRPGGDSFAAAAWVPGPVCLPLTAVK